MTITYIRGAFIELHELAPDPRDDEVFAVQLDNIVAVKPLRYEREDGTGGDGARLVLRVVDTDDLFPMSGGRPVSVREPYAQVLDLIHMALG